MIYVWQDIQVSALVCSFLLSNILTWSQRGSVHWLSHCNEICVHWTRIISEHAVVSFVRRISQHKPDTHFQWLSLACACQIYNFSWINIPNQFSPWSAQTEHVLLNDTKWQAHMWHNAPCASFHFKLNDLNSISCLLSMRLCRHANNRKFALTGIDQEPFTVSHDSEVCHSSSASDRSVRQDFIS